VVWSNAHAGVFASVTLLVLAAGGAALTAAHRAVARRLLVLAGIALVAAALTPIGPLGLARYLMLHVTLPALHTVDEFRVATWRSDAPYFVAVALAVGLTVLAAWLARRADRETNGGGGFARRHAEQILPALGFAVLGLVSVRFAADAALVLACWVAVPLATILAARVAPARTDGGETVARSASAAGTRMGRTGWAQAAVVATLLGATLLPRFAAARAHRPVFDLHVDTTTLPLSAVGFVERHGLRRHMYNDFEIGSYLAFEGFPLYRVFVDPRLPAYPAEFHRLLGRFDVTRPEWTAAMERYGVDAALLADAGLNRRVAWWDPATWALVFRADDARVFVRRTAQWRALIAAKEIPATFSFTVEEGAATQPIDERPAASPLTDCEWQRRLGDLEFDLFPGHADRPRARYERAVATRGCLPPAEEASLTAYLGGEALQHGAYARAVDYLDRAVALSGEDVRVRASRAAALEGMGRVDAALVDWMQVARAVPGTPVGKAASARVAALGTPPGPATAAPPAPGP